MKSDRRIAITKVNLPKTWQSMASTSDQITGIAWVRNQHCDCWCPGAKAPCHYSSDIAERVSIVLNKFHAKYWLYCKQHYKLKVHFGKIAPVISLQWRHNGRDGVSNHQPHDCLTNRYSGADQRKHQSSTSLAFLWESTGDRRIPCTKGQESGKCFHFNYVIM